MSVSTSRILLSAMKTARRVSWTMSGTSMSSPVTTGVIALWLQANPKLTPEDIKGVIQRTSHQPEPEFSGTDKNIYYGWDKGTSVTVFDLSGRPVLRTVSNDGIIQLPELATGVYAVQVGKQGSTLIRL